MTARLTSAALIAAGVAIGWTVVVAAVAYLAVARDAAADRRYRAHPNVPPPERVWDDGDLGDVIPIGGAW